MLLRRRVLASVFRTFALPLPRSALLFAAMLLRQRVCHRCVTTTLAEDVYFCLLPRACQPLDFARRCRCAC